MTATAVRAAPGSRACDKVSPTPQVKRSVEIKAAYVTGKNRVKLLLTQPHTLMAGNPVQRCGPVSHPPRVRTLSAFISKWNPHLTRPDPGCVKRSAPGANVMQNDTKITSAFAASQLQFVKRKRCLYFYFCFHRHVSFSRFQPAFSILFFFYSCPHLKFIMTVFFTRYQWFSLVTCRVLTPCRALLMEKYLVVHPF